MLLSPKSAEVGPNRLRQQRQSRGSLPEGQVACQNIEGQIRIVGFTGELGGQTDLTKLSGLPYLHLGMNISKCKRFENGDCTIEWAVSPRVPLEKHPPKTSTAITDR